MTDGITHLEKELQPIPKSEVRIPDVLIDRIAGNVLHDEVGTFLPVVVPDIGVIDLSDVGMSQSAEDLNLVLEPPSARLGCDRRSHHLQGDRPARVLLDRLEDLPHAAGTDESPDGVTPDLLDRCVLGRRTLLRDGSFRIDFVAIGERHFEGAESSLDRLSDGLVTIGLSQFTST